MNRRLPALLAGALLVTGLVPLSLASAVSTAAPTDLGASGAPGVWTPVGERPAAVSPSGLKRRVAPTSYEAYELDLGALDERLDRAPSQGEAARGATPVTIEVPSPEGELVEFAIQESPVMQSRPGRGPP